MLHRLLEKKMYFAPSTPLLSNLRSTLQDLCSAEWWSSTGKRLKTFSLADAKGENEMRGVMRKELITSLANALPSESLLFDHELTSIDFTTQGQVFLH